MVLYLQLAAQSFFEPPGDIYARATCKGSLCPVQKAAYTKSLFAKCRPGQGKHAPSGSLLPVKRQLTQVGYAPIAVWGRASTHRQAVSVPCKRQLTQVGYAPNAVRTRVSTHLIASITAACIVWLHALTLSTGLCYNTVNYLHVLAR